MNPFPYGGKKFSTVHRFENTGHTRYVTYSSETKTNNNDTNNDTNKVFSQLSQPKSLL